jgi:very-short-patch-repair endonuclease
MADDSSDAQRDEARISVNATLIPKINLASHQNAVPVLREVVVMNETDSPLPNVDIKLTSEPPFIQTKVWHVDEIGPQQHYNLVGLDVVLEGPLLARLNEAETAQVSVAVTSNAEEVARIDLPVQLLARNQWGGISQMPEMVAAFVQPNETVVDRILKKAADLLREHGKDPALNGYQGGSKHAWELISAIWSAVGTMGLDYALPPASFEHLGQKVRSPDQIGDSGLATCLDITLLFCAALEQCGLNPLIVFTHGHAFAGAWLRPEEFSTAVTDDVTALRKRIKLNELVLFETTLVTHRPLPKFSFAAERGSQQIAEAVEHSFELAVDVRRARMQRIKPLASTIVPTISANDTSAPTIETTWEDAPDLPDNDGAIDDHSDAIKPEGRLQRWQRKLLDLSLRNNLLSFRATKTAIKLNAADASALEDLLSEGKVIKLLPRPDLMDGSDPRNQSIHESRAQEDVRRQHANDALKRNEVFVDLGGDELESRLIELYRHARTTLQEGGSNTLYLAIGFLTWTRDDKDSKRYRAPLILVPVHLHRKSVRSGFSLTKHDDEPRFNPTLLEMLRQDFKLTISVAEGELPKDASGLDVAGIWQAVAHAIKQIRGWEVAEDVVLANFSFAKYLMWKDLIDRTDQLKQNAVVRHLIETPRERYASDTFFPSPRELDQLYAPEKTFCPLPADSSQLSAVMAAAKGKDFVLIGPPGTGKSQTISNLIAQCLAEQKRVLFVSEKMAALDVVYRRLRDVGLGEFCLELHSSKARKIDVLEQLGRAWQAKGGVDSEQWRSEAQRLKTTRDQLNTFVTQLHRKHCNGLSVFEAVGQVVAGGNIPRVGLAWPSPDAHDVERLSLLCELADKLDVNAKAVDVSSTHSLAWVAHNDWSPRWQQSLMQAASDLIPRAEALIKAATALQKAIGLPDVTLNQSGRNGLAQLAAALPMAAGNDWRFVLRPDGRTLTEQLRNGLELISAHRAQKEQLSVAYRGEATSADLTQLQTAWAAANATWWPMRWLRCRKVRKTLATFAEISTKADVGADIECLLRMRELERDVAEADALQSKTDGLWVGLNSNKDNIQRALEFQQLLSGAIAVVAHDVDSLTAVKTALERLLGDGNALLEPSGSVAGVCNAYQQTLATFQAAADMLIGLVGLDSTTQLPDKLETPAELIAVCRLLPPLEPKLNAWCAWRRAGTEATTQGLSKLVTALESGTVTPGKARELFDVDYCRWWLNAVVDNDDVLRTFVSVEHEKRIADFKLLDDTFTTLTRDYLRAGLCALLPNQESVERNSEWGILRHEMQKKQRHLPLRELISRLPTAITKLTPCLLMSPLSIAQYLSAETAPFDVVVFDEASQIAVWDAIGAMARGRQVVMVGDPKQLPPTAFFSRAETDDDDPDVESDLESILDECLGANMPVLDLSWHYRSRHESLIAFSNHRYYGGKLVTFPSPVTADRAVSFNHVKDGVYEKGGARINKPEAKALVADILSQLLDPAFISQKYTIGVVTFNAEQQKLVEDLLDEERRKHPSIEPFFAEDSLEPLFVKNLESVQGDERDVIYFSICYGPDITGAVSMNFGPMNRTGGGRRLNVAITRARQALRVFSSLNPDQIDLSRTQAEGVRDLKHFLEFAQRGPRALAAAVSGTLGNYESPFEEAVAAALISKGWQLHPQVGVSSFRIDLGVVDPDAPGRYLAGIECDGATYHRSATARDRDKLREQVLRGLGWEIVRIWSTDWWINSQDALNKVHEQLQLLLDQQRSIDEESERSKHIQLDVTTEDADA